MYDIFEGEVCYRCGGTGRHSWCTSFQDVCFACGGSGHSLTVTGRHAFNTYRSFRINPTPASSMKIGMAMEWDDMIIGGANGPQTITRSSRVESKKSVKKTGMTTFSFVGMEGSYAVESSSFVSKINEEVKMKDFSTENGWMGNIIPISLADSKLHVFDHEEIVLFVAQKVPSDLPKEWTVAKPLHPSKATMKVYWDQGWKGKANPNYNEDWFKLYTQSYMEDINNNVSVQWIDQIIKRAKEGMKVYLVCYCTSARCHTRLIRNACFDRGRNTE